MKRIYLVLLLAGLVFAGCTGEEAPAETAALDGKALFTEKCSKCHALEISTSKDKTGYGWRKTVDSMISEYGAGENPGITGAEADAIVEYLTDGY